MHHLRNLGSRITVPIKPDSDGFMGRECPIKECEGYFKVQPGTGLTGKDLPCHCPYCGHTASNDTFWTREQIEYAQSVAIRKFTDAFTKDLKSLEFNHRPRGSFGIGLSLKVTGGQPTPIRHYREKQLETEVICEHCTLRYAIYGVFAFCPDCGLHNSKQILDKNLDLAGKQNALASTAEADLASYLINDALENVVSAFDGFGRETCRVNAAKATDSTKAQNISFQSLEGARKRLQDLFQVDLAAGVTAPEWQTIFRSFHKRHVVAHKMGVVDQSYLDATQDTGAIVGRKVIVTHTEVSTLIGLVRKLAQYLYAQFKHNGNP